MKTTYPISNITHHIINNYTNILYVPHRSVFDILIEKIPANFYIENDNISSYYYDMVINNNILFYHQNYQNLTKNYHILDLILVHNSPPGALKKEDIHLLQKNTSHTYKICFDTKIASEWKILEDKKHKVINYGLPHTHINQNRDRKILILNLEKNPNLTSLYQYIKNSIKECDIMEEFPKHTSIDTLQQLFNNYDICLDISCDINALFAASCGCQCLTSVSDYNNPLITKITNFSEIMNVIQKLSENTLTHEDRSRHSKQITDNFDYNKFVDSLKQEIHNIKQKGFFRL